MISLLCFSLCLTSSLGLRVYGQCARTVGTGNSAACEHARNECGLTAGEDGSHLECRIHLRTCAQYCRLPSAGGRLWPGYALRTRS
ncbi:hypothetical protein BDZ89DRAFT_809361 [Hymenopellis radicata]|nr:hypothetical protein BDZ89DRAFT_809361 [Hymenopellis radicata]